MPYDTAAIIAIGDELALGQTVDTNTTYLAAKLAERGIVASLHITVPDDGGAILEAMRRGTEHAKLVIVTGGIGPTEDDLTRFALADLLGEKLEADAEAEAAIAAFFAHRNRAMPERNKVQAMRPASAALLRNPVGTAPAIHAVHGGSQVFVLPGVPSEMRILFDLHIVPHLEEIEAKEAGEGANTRRVILTAKLNTYGAGESDVADRLAQLMGRNRNPLLGTTVANAVVSVRIRSAFGDIGTAQQQLDDTIRLVGEALGPLIFSRDDVTLAQVVGDTLLDRKQTVATAESCTAGLVAKLLTDEPGSSAHLQAGWVVYSNDAKTRDLNVPADLIEQHGAVSEPVAVALAENARQKAETDFALALTGVAGPTGGSAEKPVGTVYIALADRTRPTLVNRYHMIGDRQMIRLRSALTAINLLRLRLINAD